MRPRMPTKGATAKVMPTTMVPTASAAAASAQILKCWTLSPTPMSSLPPRSSRHTNVLASRRCPCWLAVFAVLSVAVAPLHCQRKHERRCGDFALCCFLSCCFCWWWLSKILGISALFLILLLCFVPCADSLWCWLSWCFAEFTANMCKSAAKSRSSRWVSLPTSGEFLFISVLS